MAEKLNKLFDSEGTGVEAPSNRPLILSDPKRVWWVSSGTADLFFTPLRDGRAAGSRTLVSRLTEGSLIFGTEEVSQGQLLIIAGTEGGELLQLDRVRLRSAVGGKPDTEKELAALIEGWVIALFSSVVPLTPPKRHVALNTGGRLQLDAAEVASPAAGLTWVTSESERDGAFVTVDDFEISRENPLPVPPGAWVEAKTPTQIIALSTSELISGDPSLTFLDRFHGIYLSHLRVSWERSLAEEQSRLARKAVAFRSSFLDASEKLASLLSTTVVREPIAAEQIDTLFSACKLVGDALGVEMQPYQELHSGKKVRDPLQAIAAASRVRYRHVTLRGVSGGTLPECRVHAREQRSVERPTKPKLARLGVGRDEGA